jgi:hypothetical protein
LIRAVHSIGYTVTGVGFFLTEFDASKSTNHSPRSKKSVGQPLHRHQLDTTEDHE